MFLSSHIIKHYPVSPQIIPTINAVDDGRSLRRKAVEKESSLDSESSLVVLEQSETPVVDAVLPLLPATNAEPSCPLTSSTSLCRGFQTNRNSSVQRMCKLVELNTVVQLRGTKFSFTILTGERYPFVSSMDCTHISVRTVALRGHNLDGVPRHSLCENCYTVFRSKPFKSTYNKKGGKFRQVEGVGTTGVPF